MPPFLFSFHFPYSVQQFSMGLHGKSGYHQIIHLTPYRGNWTCSYLFSFNFFIYRQDMITPMVMGMRNPAKQTNE
jgi:hypothetical protein